MSVLPQVQTSERASFSALFNPGVGRLVIAFMMVMVLSSTTTYYILNWMPQLVADSGFPPSTGSLVSATSSLVGMVSGLLFGLAATRLDQTALASFSMIGFGLAVVAFGFTPPVLGLLMLTSGAMGLFIGGGAGLFYSTMAASLPPLMRVSGIGLVIGVGRVFSAAGPALAGWLFAAGLSRAGVSLVFAGAPALAGVLLFGVTRRRAATPQL